MPQSWLGPFLKAFKSSIRDNFIYDLKPAYAFFMDS